MENLKYVSEMDMETKETCMIAYGVREEIARLIGRKIGSCNVPMSVINKIRQTPDKIQAVVVCHEPDEFNVIQGQKEAKKRIKKVFDGYYREVLLAYFRYNQFQFYRIVKQLVGNGYSYDKLKKVIMRIAGKTPEEVGEDDN